MLVSSKSSIPIGKYMVLCSLSMPLVCQLFVSSSRLIISLADSMRLEEAKECFWGLAKHTHMSNKPILVCANKQDILCAESSEVTIAFRSPGPFYFSHFLCQGISRRFCLDRKSLVTLLELCVCLLCCPLCHYIVIFYSV